VVVSVGCGRSEDQARAHGCIMLEQGPDLADAPDAFHPLSLPPAELLEAVAASTERTLEYLQARQGLIVDYLRTGHVDQTP